MQELHVTANEAGQRLDKLLAKFLNQAPKSFLYKMMRKKNIVLNGKKCTGNEKLKQGDSIKLFFSDETIEKFSAGTYVTPKKEKINMLPIIYEDEQVLLMNKPVGVLSQKAKDSDVSAVEILINYLIETNQLSKEQFRTFHPSICNRLDRNTSGILVAGKTLPALQEMNRFFKERTIAKYYRCLVKGRVIKNEDYIKGYLVKDQKTNKVSITKKKTEEGVPIETEYCVIQSNDEVSLLEVHLITGKTHQIRAHLASIGHPIIGDYKYGDKQINEMYRQEYGLKSQLLHAYRLEMPSSDGSLAYLNDKKFVAELPDKFIKICKDKGVL
ncbi:RluA family pseudouridine synthase [Firmicutes bacterium AM43-11BH]|uniref:Pseudouridine synthase n=1 Tax=Ruminococcus hominis TaxID=2763065 RepID=A0ABR7G700_9FIRM|nr:MULTISPECIES: RluA family pseudouridine synthase [Clostridia]RGH41494.1 RluA family pseudouridine synthase [Firmicutes bacterium AM41-5BH]RHS82450.1 RluA family pseudouridine synthase [Firmicutes bacterium AM43-11BH]RHV08038.1 RluA family pseudouridine synthase [Firmicutes bacterium OM07-11]MBC5683216.1 RluA family pseudouridine synthase [Ruminococcus hominis]MCH4278808.1 RluA family pseudouridine synthase [Mediterraneibacter sp. NSJ-151]